MSTSGGRCNFDDGGCYTGTWHDGMSHGHGICTGPMGQGEFAGSWQFGFEVSGIYTWTSGNYYEGQWLQGKRHGLGVERKGHWLYRGEWTQGFKGRYGLRQSTVTGLKFEGTWTSGLQDGYGVETYADGGTFQGQWLRGVRHGYGVRQSVSYDLAARYQAGPLPASTLNVAASGGEEEAVIRDRDRRTEENRGGFVLLSRTTPDEAGRKKRLLLDKYGRPSLRKTIVNELRLIRQKSTGDIQEQPPRSGSRSSGGSVRSTVSTISQSSAGSTRTTGSVYSDDEGSFVSQADVDQGNVVERYLGEWKNDRRAGFGICERSDGLKYEGEWFNNKKHGYGVTTLRDGSRFEGKYKNNVLVSSGRGSKLFLLRSTKIRDRVESAVLSSHKAADIAKEKADIANARMTSARVKCEQAEEIARQAVADAEMARAKAQEYSPNSGQAAGAKIIANRLQEEELLVEYESSPTSDQLAQIPTSPKRFHFFRSKKDEGSRWKNEVSPQLRHHPGSINDPTTSTSSTIQRNTYIVKPSQPGASYNSATLATNFQNSGQGPMPNSSHRFQPQLTGGAALQQTTQAVRNNQLIGGFQGSDGQQWGSSTTSPVFQMNRPQQQFTMTTMEGQFQAQNFPLHGGGSPPASPGDRSPEFYPSSFGRPFDDAYNWVGYDGMAGGVRERRKSLPSIVKEKTQSPPGTTTNQPHSPTTTTTTTTTAAMTPHRPQKPLHHTDTFIIEDGIRKKVKPLYRDLGLPPPTDEGLRKLPKKLYALESPKLYRKGDQGSMPDVSAVKDMEIMPREAVYVMSQQRREELIIERAEQERRRRNTIVLRLGDFKDWCQRRQVLVFVLAVNLSLATVFYSMLQ